jgi:hypothetical protein
MAAGATRKITRTSDLEYYRSQKKVLGYRMNCDHPGVKRLKLATANAGRTREVDFPL